MSEFDLPDIARLDEETLILVAEKRLAEAGDNVQMRLDAINTICTEMVRMDDEAQAELYINELSKKFKIAKKIFREKYKALKESQNEAAAEKAEYVIPKEFMDEIDDLDAAYRLGYWKHRNKYYFLTKEGTFKGSNFVIVPLFHIYSKYDNKRLIEVVNEHGHRRILDVPSQYFTSLDMFQQAVYKEGNFIFFGSKLHFMKILAEISSKFPVCNELKTLGWQREGFFAFANGIYNGEWQPVDGYGITVHKSEKFFSPAFSVVYKEVREDDDEYENDRFFVWKESKVSFSQWAHLMIRVYGEKAFIAIAYLIAAAFRDVIYEKYKIFPHLFLFGEKQSGKSNLAWSLSNVFFNNLPAFNLNSGTQVGFFRRLSRIRNAVVWFDEYTNDIDEKRYQALKSAYDGMGHEKGKMTRDSRTEITKVNSACVISGQYLPTRDDNALFTRSIVLNFEKKTYSPKEMAIFDTLKGLEIKGLSSILGELLKYRSDIDEAYAMTFSGIYDLIKSELMREAAPFDERLVRNFVSILTPIKILSGLSSKIDFGFTYMQIFHLAKNMISDLSAQISSSEALSTFWNMVEYLLDSKLITPNVDFKIASEMSIIIRNRKGEQERIDFDQPVKLLYVRLKNIHPLYMEHHRRQYGIVGVDKVSLEHYIQTNRAFKGRCESVRFSNQITSARVLLYDQVPVNLERFDTAIADEPTTEPF